MNGLTLQIINGNRKALALAKTCITTPTLINLRPEQGALYAIPLEVETNQREASAEVSDSLVITSEAKKHVSDNVAPGSKSWNLTGYISGMKSIEPTNYFKPFVQLFSDILWSWFDHGAVLVFRDGDARIFEQVVIKSFKTSQQKDSQSAIPFTMTLKEIQTMQTSLLDIENTKGLLSVKQALKSVAPYGSALGFAATLGITMSEIIKDTAEQQESTE